MAFSVQKNVPLAPYTTLGVGGNAEYFTEVHSLEELRDAVVWARNNACATKILGGGSNVLISDAGIQGLVIRPLLNTITYTEEGEHTLVTVGAGVVLDTLVQELVHKKLWGLENFSAIPGSVGAVPIQNVGAYGVEAKDVVHAVTVFDMEGDSLYEMTNAECLFAYRDSYFKHTHKKLIIVSVTFVVTKNPFPRIAYKELSEIFSTKDEVMIDSVRDAIVRIRSKKFPDWRVVGTAGSFFKNPIIEEKKYARLREVYPELPGYVHDANTVKIPLGWVLDHVCKLKGYTEGRVKLFEQQALVLVCEKNIEAIEIENFAQKIIDRVYAMTNIVIEKEVTQLN